MGVAGSGEEEEGGRFDQTQFACYAILHLSNNLFPVSLASSVPLLPDFLMKCVKTQEMGIVYTRSSIVPYCIEGSIEGGGRK